ncbi:Protein of unknown function [Gryllus bimaculatus]|nr:Protein of unknown function [Gryllus bimaculatus]
MTARAFPGARSGGRARGPIRPTQRAAVRSASAQPQTHSAAGRTASRASASRHHSDGCPSEMAIGNFVRRDMNAASARGRRKYLQLSQPGCTSPTTPNPSPPLPGPAPPPLAFVRMGASGRPPPPPPLRQLGFS